MKISKISTTELSPQKRRKLHTVFCIDHVVYDFVMIQDGLGDIQPQAAAAAVPVS